MKGYPLYWNYALHNRPRELLDAALKWYQEKNLGPISHVEVAPGFECRGESRVKVQEHSGLLRCEVLFMVEQK